ncbi:MAG: alpha-L-fucosidase [Cyclobacteriaceae bacterium]
MKFAIPLLLILYLSACRNAEVAPPAALFPIPSQAQLQWHQMEQNAFIHFTTNTFTDKEWGFGDENPTIFNPTSFDADRWISTLKEAGFRGAILTCKHHDGFCLWPSEYTDRDVAASPWKDGKGDVVREVADACRRHGLKFGVYLSPWDRNHAEYGRPLYIEYYRNQLKEIFSRYGPVFEMWFDGANGGTGYYGGAREKRSIDGARYYEWPVTLSFVRQMEPDVLFFSDAGPGVRWVGNERGVAGETNWNTITPDTLYAGRPGITELLNTGHPQGTHWIPAEVDVSIRPGWFYHEKEDSLVKSPEKLFDIYLTSVGRGSTLLLNIPPDKRGLLHEKDVAALKGWRKLLDEAFDQNLALKAEVTASEYRGKSKRFDPSGVTDGDAETYWTTNDSTTSASLDVNLPENSEIKFLLIQEYIKLGQRVSAFNVEYWEDNTWKPLASAATIGYKRILKFTPVKTDKIRINITDSKACPVISNLEVY